MHQRLLAYFLVLTMAVIGIIDISLSTAGMPTISDEIRALANGRPWIPLGAGLLIGHLFL